MGRVLTTVRVAVTASRRDAYLESLAALAALHASRGNHIWLFGLRGEPGAYLECSEGAAGSHRGLGPRTETETRLEARLRELGSYADQGDLWEEIPLRPHPKE